RIIRKPPRTSAWSSAISTRVMARPRAAGARARGSRRSAAWRGLERQARVHAVAAARQRAGLERAAEQRCALAHPDQAAPAPVGGGAAAPVVAHVDLDGVGVVAH